MDIATLYPVLKPLLFALDAETAHRATINALKLLKPVSAHSDDPALRVTLWNRNFPNPVGLAAGFDQNAEIIAPLFGSGFGFVEAGTVTPKPQHGNPRPRIFRDKHHGAVISHMGFPNQGMNAFKLNLEKFLDSRPRPSGLLGINIGMNKSQTDPAKDYCLLVRMLGPFADYLTVNIPAADTAALRNLQEPETFLDLTGKIIAARDLACGKEMPPPLLVKLAPDLDEGQQQELADAILKSGIDGLILTNTTLRRPEMLPASFAKEKGGLSGEPLRDQSTTIIRNFYRLTAGKIPIIGAGGISCAQDAYDKIRAGASLVQLYSALAFHGPAIIKKINRDLPELLKADGFSRIQDAVGTGA